MNPPLLRFDNTLPRDFCIEAWFLDRQDNLGVIAQRWFQVMRECGDEVREVLHDGCPNACFGDYPFAYVNVFKDHVNVGFFQGASLPDPEHLLQGTGKHMRHVKLKSASPVDPQAIDLLIHLAYRQMKSRVERG